MIDFKKTFLKEFAPKNEKQKSSLFAPKKAVINADIKVINDTVIFSNFLPPPKPSKIKNDLEEYMNLAYACKAVYMWQYDFMDRAAQKESVLHNVLHKIFPTKKLDLSKWKIDEH